MFFVKKNSVNFSEWINLSVCTFLFLIIFLSEASGQFFSVTSREPEGNEIPVYESGYYDKPGATYILMNDISSSTSSVFLGKDVIFNLNGYTLTFCDDKYEHVPNFSFEEGLKHWDFTKAPTAKIEDTKVHVFVGDKVLRLSKGEEIVSEYINLPVSERSYIAMCGVVSSDMKVSVYVEDEKGKSVVCNTEYNDGVKQSCPVENRSPRLGGGFVSAHLNKLEAGKYRIRVKAETDCIVDYIDIMPAMDTGIGIVEKTFSVGHNDHFYERQYGAFFDYTEDVKNGKPLSVIPQVSGKGTVTVKNGIIRNGADGAVSWGIKSTAENVKIILDNVKIVNSGINAIAVDVPSANILNCFFDVNNPFIINRHGSEFYAVDLYGEYPSEVSNSVFYGGQGCLSFKGDFSSVHHNNFVNRQTVTNHYSIMAMGDSSLIFSNYIEPETGSGIEIYVHRGIEIFNNTFRITASPPTCEYGHEDYSVTAVRIADYNAKSGSVNGCFGNKIYNNKIYITGKDYDEYIDYTPMAWAVFYSASGGDNFIFGNDIFVNDLTPELKNETSAFYIGGGSVGGQFFNNRITTNVTAAWVASRYGGAQETKLFNNKIINAAETGKNIYPFRMGWDHYKECIAKDVEFRSNEFEGFEFGIDESEQAHSYSVWWNLKIHVTNKKGESVANCEIVVLNEKGEKVISRKTDAEGILNIELKDYSVVNKKYKTENSYTVLIGTKKEKINLNKNLEINITI